MSNHVDVGALVGSSEGLHHAISIRSKLLIGGVGGAMPILASFLIVEDQLVASLISAIQSDEPGATANLIGYCVRAVGLFLLGAFWVWLHKTVHEPMKVFQLGMVGPAMAMMMLNASNVDQSAVEEAATRSISPPVELAVFMPQIEPRAALDPFNLLVHENPRRDPPKPGSIKCIIDGMLGRKC